MTGSGSSTGSAEFPVAAHPVAQRTHGDVVSGVADLHAAERGVEGVGVTNCKLNTKKTVGTLGTMKSSDNFQARLQLGAEHSCNLRQKADNYYRTECKIHK